MLDQDHHSSQSEAITFLPIHSPAYFKSSPLQVETLHVPEPSQVLHNQHFPAISAKNETPDVNNIFDPQEKTQRDSVTPTTALLSDLALASSTVTNHQDLPTANELSNAQPLVQSMDRPSLDDSEIDNESVLNRFMHKPPLNLPLVQGQKNNFFVKRKLQKVQRKSTDSKEKLHQERSQLGWRKSSMKLFEASPKITLRSNVLNVICEPQFDRNGLLEELQKLRQKVQQLEKQQQTGNHISPVEQKLNTRDSKRIELEKVSRPTRLEPITPEKFSSATSRESLPLESQRKNALFQSQSDQNSLTVNESAFDNEIPLGLTSPRTESNHRPSHGFQRTENRSATNRIINSKMEVPYIQPIAQKENEESPKRFYRTPRPKSPQDVLEFNMENQKIVLDSHHTQDMPFTSQDEERPTLKKAEALLPVLPDIDIDINLSMTDEALLEVGKKILNGYGTQVDANTQFIVRRYRNCVLISADPDNNLLWHYQGKLYFGGWTAWPQNSDGDKHGHGIQYQPDKMLYAGGFKYGKKSGDGVLKSISKEGKTSIYVGQMLDGLKSGSGYQVEEGGLFYKGEWKNGRKEGLGKLFVSDNEFYEGTFGEGQKEGFGKERFRNGDSYQGHYRGGKFHGKGMYHWVNGSRYEGEFKEGLRNGFGIWHSAPDEGDVYEGCYKDDLKHGQGVYRWQNGSCYEGTFYRDLKHGVGTIVYENGKIVRMQWENGQVVKRLKLESQPNQQQQQPQLKFTQNSKSIRSSRSFSSVRKAGIVRPPDSFGREGSQSGRLGEGIKFKNTQRGLSLGAPSKSESGGPRASFGVAIMKGPGPIDPPYRGIQSSTNLITF